MKTLSMTSAYNYAEMLGNVKLTNGIRQLIDIEKGAIFITENMLEDAFYKIRHKSFNYKAKFGVIDLFRKGIIRLVYNPEVKLTVAAPFFGCKLQSGGIGVIINVSNYGRLDKDNTSLTIDPMVLYTLMLAGAYSINIEFDEGLLSNSGVPEFYSDLFIAVVSRMANLDMMRREKIKFIMNKFMYIQLGNSEPRASAAAKKELKYIDAYSIEQIDLAIPTEAYDNLESICNKMREVLPEFKTVTFGMIFDRWMKSYGETSGFAIEYIPYLILLFCAVIMNCNSIVNVKAIEKEANKDARRLVMLFDRIENTVHGISQR